MCARQRSCALDFNGVTSVRWESVGTLESPAQVKVGTDPKSICL